ncbi:MAG TPA: GNAT family N-acetyltransferase, partial [Thermoanaerobaculia bacterium]|nr:GNAT family N-acetyltransferase [Thermoanaerobaculia bacterium]
AASMLDALETISRDCFHSFGVLRDTVVIDDADATGAITTLPITFFNGIGTTQFDQADADRRVDELIARFGKPFRWWILPTSQPSNLREILERHGLRHVYDSAGMTLDLAHLAQPPQGIIERVVDDAQMHVFADVLTTVFERPKSDIDIWTSAYGQIGYDRDWAHFIAYDEGKPVATASVLMCGDVAGIYLVGTLKEARGRGLGTAATLAALHYGRERGARVAALQSSAIGESVYHGMGFVSHGVMPMYEWRYNAAP